MLEVSIPLLERQLRRGYHAILGTASQPAQQRILRAKVVSRQAPAGAGSLADASQRCPVDAALSDQFRRRVQQGGFRLASSLRLRASSRWSRHAGAF